MHVVLDSRRLADRQLKSTCEAFIDYCGDFLIEPIRVFLAKVHQTRVIFGCKSSNTFINRRKLFLNQTHPIQVD